MCCLAPPTSKVQRTRTHAHARTHMMALHACRRMIQGGGSTRSVGVVQSSRTGTSFQHTLGGTTTTAATATATTATAPAATYIQGQLRAAHGHSRVASVELLGEPDGGHWFSGGANLTPIALTPNAGLNASTNTTLDAARCVKMVLVTRGRHPDRPSVVEVLLNQDGSPVWYVSHPSIALFFVGRWSLVLASLMHVHRCGCLV